MRKAITQAPRLIRVSTTRIDGGVVFGATPKMQWEPFISPDRQNQVALGNYSLLIDHPDGWILVNAGPGDKAPLDLSIAPVRSRSCLLRELREACLTPKDIATVVLTNLHDEYAGGATHMTSSGKVVPTFSNARYVAQRADFEAATAPSDRSRRLYRPDDFLPLQEANQLDLVEGPTEIAEGVWVEPAPGPTPGHQVVRFEREGTSFLFMGLLVPTTMHLRAPVLSSIDWSPDTTMATKRRLLRRAALGNWQIAPTGCGEWIAAADVVMPTERDAGVERPDAEKPRVLASVAAD